MLKDKSNKCRRNMHLKTLTSGKREPPKKHSLIILIINNGKHSKIWGNTNKLSSNLKKLNTFTHRKIVKLLLNTKNNDFDSKLTNQF
jgi:hypothetical protein